MSLTAKLGYDQKAIDLIALDCCAALRGKATGAALADSHLRRLAELVFDPERRHFVTGELTPRVSIISHLQPSGEYMFAADFNPVGQESQGILPGSGVPLIRQRPNMGSADAHLPPGEIFEAVTLTGHADLRIDGRVEIHLVPMEGSALPDSAFADATAQAYLRLVGKPQSGRLRIRREVWSGLAKPAAMSRHSDFIYLVEPFDPNRIPILMIHGLKSGPIIWRDLTMGILLDRRLHARFQVWHAFYPTGLPPFWCGSRIRLALKGLLERFDPDASSIARNHMAVIGHSMGGLLARMLVTEDHELLWRTTFTVSPDELAASLRARERWQELLTLHREPGIDFVGFINTPHRGSHAANHIFSRMFAAIIQLPEYFRELFDGGSSFLDQSTPAMRRYGAIGGPSSVHVLSPDFPLIRAFATLPIASGVRVASVIGVKGGPEHLRNGSEMATDGIVDYSSAHLEQGDELVIHAGHAAYAHPATIHYFQDQLWRWQAEI